MKLRPSRHAGLAILTGLIVVATTATPAAAHLVEDTLPGGTNISVSIDSPADGALLPQGPATVTGTAAVGEGEPNTALVYVLDVSFTTGSISGCPQPGDTVQACEIAAAIALNGQAVDTVGAVGAVVFASNPAQADVQPLPPGADERITGPATDENGNGTPDIEEVLASASFSGVGQFTNKTIGNGTTDFGAAITAARDVALDPANTMDRTIVVFLSDGLSNVGQDFSIPLATIPDNVDFFTFAIGAGSDCATDPAGLGSLQEIADATGGECQNVPTVADLPDDLLDTFASELSTLTLDDGIGAPSPITNVTPSLPQEGPASVTYTATTDPLPVGTHELCVTATGSDVGGTGDVTECHTVTVFRPGEAFAIQATGPVTIPKTPHATCPPDETLTQAALNVAPLAVVNGLNADCTVDPATGETVATASIDQASLLGGAIVISNIESSCVSNADGVTRSSSVGTINGNPIGIGSGSITIPLVATVFFNETTTNAQGQLVQNAIRVQTLLGQQIILAGCRLG
jgi:hypothetical protein